MDKIEAQTHAKEALSKSSTHFKSRLKKYASEAYDFIMENYEGETPAEKIYLCIEDIERPLCPQCKTNYRKFEGPTKGYKQQYCSKKCSASSPEVHSKYKTTCLRKYGHTSANLSKDVQAKRKATTLKRHGVEHPLQSKEIMSKKKTTMIEKYGVENALQNKNIRWVCCEYMMLAKENGF